MKTLAFLFSALSLVACATDPDREVGPIDKASGHAVDSLIAEQADEWVEQQISGERPISGLANAAADRFGEEVRGPRPIDELDDKAAIHVGGARPIGALDDKLQDRLQQLLGEQRHIDEALNDDAREWAEELVVDGRSYTLIHGPHGAHQVLDALGNPLDIRGVLSVSLPSRER